MLNSTGLNLISIVISLIAAAFSIITYRNSMIHDRKQATLEAYNQLQEQALDQLYRYSPKYIKDIAKQDRSEAYKQISVYIARIEHFCVGVEQKIYDQKTVYELAHGFLDGSIKSRIMPMIDNKCNGREDYYHNTRNVLNKMEEYYKMKNKK